ncbi:hypothetical protein LINPERPRIM_LOCUS4873 [Linum perenne]
MVIRQAISLVHVSRLRISHKLIVLLRFPLISHRM